MSRDVIATISLQALQHNYQWLRERYPKQAILAMIKSNAYGHGMISVANALPDMDAFGIACVEEAITLRAAGVKVPLVLMPGFSDAGELQQCAQAQLVPVIHEWTQLACLQATPLPHPLKVWLKIDTGMHRLGFLPKDVAKAYEQLRQIPWVQHPVGLMTHLARADDADQAFTASQLTAFQALTQHWPGPKSIANSAAILRYPETLADWIRPGIMLYGVSPFAQEYGLQHGLQPVMTLQAKLIALHDLQAGDAIGYGGTYRCTRPMRVGVVAIGYGDGYPWHAKNGTPVLIRGKRCSLAGRVSMDMITVDLTACPEAQVGDRVTLWGEGLPVEEIAAHASTIPYQLFCNLTTRVKVVTQPIQVTS